ncbi:MAG: acyl-CoA dehydrogenase family protein [Pseudomonadales bacterium]
MNAETSSSPLSATEIKRRVTALAEEIRERNLAPEFDELRALPVDVVEKLRDAGVFRMNMPTAWGGPEMSSPDQVEVIETLSRADGSVGWCAFIWCDSGLYSGYLEQTVAKQLYPRLDMAQSGWVYPAGRADRVPGGYRVNARWIFGSGSNHCDMLAGGCTVFENGEPKLGPRGNPEWRIMLAEPAAYTIEDTWYTTGLRGTGSNDYVAQDLFVPEEHTFSFFQQPYRDGPLWKRPDTLLRKMSGVPLGIARDAIDRAVDILKDKVDRVSRAPYREMQSVRHAVAKAEAKLGAARAYVYSSLEAQWHKLERDEPLTPAERAATFLARQHAFQTAREVVQIIYDTIGGAAVYAKAPFDRQMRDMMTACQHIVAQEKTAAEVGGLLLGLDEGRGML